MERIEYFSSVLDRIEFFAREMRNEEIIGQVDLARAALKMDVLHAVAMLNSGGEGHFTRALALVEVSR